jgi:SecD/SecF fusion protein
LGILLVMYIVGGEGIHGFTFVMLLGIIAGTYSSVAIAAPLILIGASKSDSVAITKPSRTQPAAG